MRVAVLGHGSIGARHARLARALGHELSVYDPAPAVAPPPGEAAASVEECLEGAEAAIVASPSSEHLAHARAAIELGVPVLVEKPLALDWARAAELDWLARERRVTLSVAMNLREHEGVRALRELLAEDAAGRVLHARAWCGSWLPGWHPGEDYRRRYSARRELGGGALLDVAVHELDYLLWLLGPARAVSAMASHVSDLEMDVEDVAEIALELRSGAVAQVSVDYLDRSYARGCRIVGSERTLRWSWAQERVSVLAAEGEVGRARAANDIDTTYRAELEHFLQAVHDGEPAPVPASSAQDVLALIDAARASAREGRHVRLAPALELRAAREQDAQLLLEWRNDPETRRSSREQREIEPEEHASWLRGILAGDPAPPQEGSTLLWIAECEGRPVASVRVGPRMGMAAEVHLAVAPEERGRGVGAGALVQASARALADPGLELLRAHVKPGNEASLRAFARAGFARDGAAMDGLVRLERPKLRERPTAGAGHMR